MIAKILIACLLLLTIFVGYNSIQAAPQPKVEQKRQDKSQRFCNGLNIPQQRQCPTMDDL